MLRWLAAILIGSLLGIPSAAALWVATAPRDPPQEGLVAFEAGRASVQTRRTQNGRIREDVTLDAGEAGDVRFVLDRPEGVSGPMPVIVLLGGAPGGAQALAYMPPVGRNAVLSLDWPMPVPDALPRDWALVPAIPDLRRRILSAPGQVAAVRLWLERQSWADAERVVLVGVSLGALIAPAAQFMAQEALNPVEAAAEAGLPTPLRRPAFNATLLAFGGADLGAMVRRNPVLSRSPIFGEAAFGGGPALEVLAWTTANLLHGLEPTHYLPLLEGEFMVVNASEDRVVPASSIKRFTELTPQPKDVLTVAGGHIGTDPETARILRTTISVAASWLISGGFIASPHEASLSGGQRIEAAPVTPVASEPLDPLEAEMEDGADADQPALSPAASSWPASSSAPDPASD